MIKTILLLTVAVALASCASNSEKGLSRSTNSNNAILNIRFADPVNELFPEQRKYNKSITSIPLVTGSQQIQFPLTQAVQCNRDKTECKHAVVSTLLEFDAKIQPSQNIIEVTGILHSEMGRSLETKSSSGSSQQAVSRTLPESVPLIGETKSDKPFQGLLKRGEVLELNGLADAKVFLEFQ